MLNKQWFLHIIFLLFLFHGHLHAQYNLVPANPANIFDAKSSFVNPAMLSFQRSQLLLGMKVFHLGFVESDAFVFRNNYISATTPYIFSDNVVFGITGQYFGIPLYNQSQVSFLVSSRVLRKFAVGLKYNILNHSFNKNQFDQIDSYDPVFSNGTTKVSHSFGMGMLAFPVPGLCIGFSLDHINRPDISLIGDGIHQPYVFDFGIRYSYKLFSSIITC